MKNFPWIQISLLVLSIAVVIVLIAAFNGPPWLIALPIIWGPSIGLSFRSHARGSQKAGIDAARERE